MYAIFNPTKDTYFHEINMWSSSAVFKQGEHSAMSMSLNEARIWLEHIKKYSPHASFLKIVVIE